MAQSEIWIPTLKREITREVADHEVFLGFRDDWQAAAFTDWLRMLGFRMFHEWAESHKGQYE